MAATSPYSQNDNSAFQFRPMELPINDIFKGIMVKNQYWTQKAEQIKNQYDTALGLDLTLEENQQLKKDYISNARKEMKKLSGMELTDPEVQKQSEELFRPLFQDRGIALDDHLTKLRKNIISTAMSYRDKDGGKEYSDINFEDSISAFENFNSRTSRQDIESVYEQAKNSRYVPYYYFSKTVEDSLTNCKGRVSTDTDAAGLNWRVTKSTGISAAVASNCIESAIAMDNKAMEQIAINGRVNYRNNREGLVNDVSSYLQQNISSTRDWITKLQTDKLAALKAGVNTEIIDKYDQEIKTYSDLLRENSNYVNQIASGNYKSIDDNYAGWAQKVYKKNIIDSYALPRATESTSVTYEGNAGAIAEYKERGINQRFTIGEQNQMQRHAENLQNDRLKTMISLLGDVDAETKSKMLVEMGYGDYVPVLNRMGESQEVLALTAQDITASIQSAEKETMDATNDIIQSMKLINGDDKIVDAIENISANPTQAEKDLSFEVAKNYIEKKLQDVEARKKAGNSNAQLNSEDQRLMEALNKYNNAVNVTSAIKNSYKRIKSDYDNGEGRNLFINNTTLTNNFLQSPDLITDVRGNQYNKEELVSILSGTNGDYKVELKPTILGSDDLVVTDIRSGKKLTFDERNQSYDKVRRLYRQLQDEENNYNAGLDRKIGENTVVNRFVQRGTEADNKLLTQEFVAVVPNGAQKGLRFQVKSKDLRTGLVTFEIYDDSQEGGGQSIPLTKKEFEEKFGATKSGIQVNQYFNVTPEGKIQWKNEAFKKGNYSKQDEALSIVKIDLKQEVSQANRPSNRTIYKASSDGTELILEAVPFSSGVEYNLKIKKPFSSGSTTVRNGSRLTEDQVDAAVQDAMRMMQIGSQKIQVNE